MKTFEDLLRDIGGHPVYTDRGLPVELALFSCFVPDCGYCVLSIPMCFVTEAAQDPGNYTIPIPEKYILEKGWRMCLGFPCVEVPYSSVLGAEIPEEYESWE